jgi:hypothetical protein
MTIKYALKGTFLNSQPLRVITGSLPGTDVEVFSGGVVGSGFEDINLGVSALVERQIDNEEQETTYQNTELGGVSTISDSVSADPRRPELILTTRLFSNDYKNYLSLKSFESSLDITDYLFVARRVRNNADLAADRELRVTAARDQREKVSRAVRGLDRILDIKNTLCFETDFLTNNVKIHKNSRKVLDRLPSKFIETTAGRSLNIERTLPVISEDENLTNLNSLGVLMRSVMEPDDISYSSPGSGEEFFTPKVNPKSVKGILNKISNNPLVISDYSQFEKVSNILGSDSQTRLKNCIASLSYECLMSNGINSIGKSKTVKGILEENFPPRIKNYESINPEQNTVVSYFKSLEGYQIHDIEGLNLIFNESLKAGSLQFETLQRIKSGLESTWGSYLQDVEDVRFNSEFYDAFNSPGLILNAIGKLFNGDVDLLEMSFFRFLSDKDILTKWLIFRKIFAPEFSTDETEDLVDSSIKFSVSEISTRIFSNVEFEARSQATDAKLISNLIRGIQDSKVANSMTALYEELSSQLNIFNKNLQNTTVATNISDSCLKLLCFESILMIVNLFSSVNLRSLSKKSFSGDTGTKDRAGKAAIGFLAGIAVGIAVLALTKKFEEGGELLSETYKVYFEESSSVETQLTTFRSYANFGNLSKNNSLKSLLSEQSSNELRTVIQSLAAFEDKPRERYAAARQYYDSYISNVDEALSAISNEKSLTASSIEIYGSNNTGYASLSSEMISAMKLNVELSRPPLKMDYKSAESQVSPTYLNSFRDYLVSLGRENSIIAAVGLPSLTIQNLKSDAAAKYAIPFKELERNGYVDITFFKRNTQFSEVIFTDTKFSFYPRLHVIALPNEVYQEDFLSTSDSFYFFVYEDNTWKAVTKGYAVQFVLAATGFETEEEATVIVNNHIIDAVCKSALRNIGNVSLDEMIAVAPRTTIITQEGLDFLTRFINLPQAFRIISESGLSLGDFFRPVAGGYEFIPFSELRPEILVRTDEPTHRLLHIVVSDPIFSYENYYSSSSNFTPFERIYCCLIDPESDFECETNLLETDVLNYLTTNGILEGNKFLPAKNSSQRLDMDEIILSVGISSKLISEIISEI